VIVTVGVVTSGFGLAAHPAGENQPFRSGGTSPASPVHRSSHSSHHRTGSGSLLVPASGAYLGAYVQPEQYTSRGEIAAIQSFEQLTSNSLSLIHVYRQWRVPFPTTADRYFASHGKVMLVTWSGAVDTRKLIAGTYDALIRRRAEAIRKLGYPILLEFRHEMDRPNLQGTVHGAKAYRAAWDHIRAIFDAVGTTNVGWVWCPTGYGFLDGRAEAFYPGSGEVDWVCADIYSPSSAHSLAEVARPFLRWAARTGKPVLIGEFGVGGDPASWPAWLAAAGRLPLTDPQIKGMAYFDANGTDSNGRPFHYWLAGNSLAVESFTQLMALHRFKPKIPAGI